MPAAIPDPPVLPAGDREHARRWRWVALLLVPAASVGAMLVFLPGRAIGAASLLSLGLSARDADGGEITLEGSSLARGQVISFHITAPGAGTALVVRQTERGLLLPCVANPDGSSVPVAGGSEVPLAQTWTVEDAPGAERLYLVWTPGVVTFDQVRDAAGAARSTWRDRSLPIDAMQVSTPIGIH